MVVRSFCGMAVTKLARVAAFVGCASVVFSLHAAELAGLSAEVVKLCGRDQGLFAVVGVGDADAVKLTCGLAGTGRILVHGIALTDASLTEARSAIRAAGVAGFASVEKLALSPIPYRDNVVNVMVVPDLAAAQATGFSQAEALKAVAPLGKLCVRTGGTWTVTEREMPTGMDEWTHNIHGPDGNRVSNDTVVGFPVGYRWHAGLPFNINNRKRQGNRYSSTRGMAISGGRCFTFSDSEIDNLKGAYFLGQELDQYVTARDAFNGTFLWRKKIGRVYYGGLWYMNMAPFAAVDDAVYTVCEEGDLLVLDAATGNEVRRIDTTYGPGELLVDKGILVAATWKGGTWVGESKVNRYERRRMHSAVSEGAVEAFRVDSGSKLWSLPCLATSIRSAGGVLFLSRREGADLLEESRRYKPKTNEPKAEEVGEQEPITRPSQAVVAVDLRTGKVLWETKAVDFAGEGYEQEHLRLDAVGIGVVTVVHAGDLRAGKVTVLSARTGEVVMQKETGQFPVLLGNSIHLGGKMYDPQTGDERGTSGKAIGSTVCTPSYIVNDIIVRNRGGGFSVDGKSVIYAGARGACGTASAPSYGAFYTPQNWCTCCPPQISGFICFGPVRGVPSPEEMMAVPIVEKGVAFGRTAVVGAGQAVSEWPTFRHGASRGCGTAAIAPTTLNLIWKRKVESRELAGPVAVAWQEYLNSALTAPTVGCGVVTAAVMDGNQVVGLDLNDGRVLWSIDVGTRVDSSPTIYQDTCLFGAHDGYVYSLDCRNGELRWKMRMAPNDERMVSYGKVESPWPVVGSVLVADGVAYASAGRTQGSDGGIVVRAFSPFTGEVNWSKVIDPTGGVRNMRRNDVMLAVDDALQLMITRLDPGTGELVENPTREVNMYHSQLAANKRNLARYKQQLAAAGGKSDHLEKRIADTEKALADLEEPEGEIAPFLGRNGTGSEGYVNWNWPRLGYRKFRQMNYGNISGTLVSWGAKLVCRMTQDRRLAAYAMEKVGKVHEKLSQPADWSVQLPAGYQMTSLVVCANAVIAGGGVYDADDPAKRTGFVTVLSRETGEKTVEYAFVAPVVFGGVVALDKKICVALESRSVCMLGE